MYEHLERAKTICRLDQYSTQEEKTLKIMPIADFTMMLVAYKCHHGCGLHRKIKMSLVYHVLFALR